MCPTGAQLMLDKPNLHCYCWCMLTGACLPCSLQLKIAQSARASVGHQYDRAQERLRSLESQLRSMLSLQEKVTGEALPEHSGDESDDDIQWLPPHEEEEAKTFLQSTLDYAKQLSERVYGALQSVVKATTYLPHHLKIGAIQAYTQAHDLYTSLKGVSLPQYYLMPRCMCRFPVYHR